MDPDKILDERDLYDRYLHYTHAHGTQRLADIAARRGDAEGEALWQKTAAERFATVQVDDRDALRTNVYLDRLLTYERHDIVTRLREQDPPTSWTTIGELLGMSKQAAHRWHARGFIRHLPPDNPAIETTD